MRRSERFASRSPARAESSEKTKVFPIDQQLDDESPFVRRPQALASTDDVWAAVRKAKDPLLAKTSPKVDSLRIHRYEEPHLPPSPPDSIPPRPRAPRKRRSSTQLIVSNDKQQITMIFNVEGVKRSDVHVAFKRSHLMVSWSTTTTELEEDGVLVREHRAFQRAIPLPEGTQFHEVSATKETGQLIVTYPNSKVVRLGS